MKKKVLICGATGFIGRNIAEAMAANDDYEIYGTYFRSKPWHHPKVTMVKVDLTDKVAVDGLLKGKEIVVQAAAVTSGAGDIVKRPYIHVTDNAVMNSLILRSAFENQVSRFVFFSCTVMYQSSDQPIKENDFNPSQEMVRAYFGAAWTKVYIEKMCEFYSRLGKTKFTILRHSNIYGPYDKYDLERAHVFGASMAKVLANKDGKIVVWGSGESARDLLYVSDLVTCVESALDKQRSDFEIFNVGSGYAVSVKALVEKVIDHSGRDFKIEYDQTKPDIKTKLCLDISKIRQRLGWSPTVALDEGIIRTKKWYEDNRLSLLRSGRVKA